jgi:hypothetical protein
MDEPPKTRQERKKRPREKRPEVYSAKHARLAMQSFTKPKSK